MTVYADIDLDAVRHNIAKVSEVAQTPICAVVKADGYGHGALPVAAAAVEAGATWLAVATVSEAVAVSATNPLIPVLVLSERPAVELNEFAGRLPDNIRLTVATERGVRACTRLGARVRLHLKIDTGMHRMGADPAEAVEIARLIESLPQVELEGVWTHLAQADNGVAEPSDAQLVRFEEVLGRLTEAGISPPMRHVANSAGTLAHPASRHDLVRIGIAMYGVAPSEHFEGVIGLRPALRLSTSVSAVRDVRAGESVSYGGRWSATVAQRVATLPVGYADAVRRDSGLHGVEVLIGSRRRRIVGNVTMDQTMVLVDEHVLTGDEAVLIGDQGQEAIGANDVARHLGTIGYEVLTSIGPRVVRRYG